MIEGVVAKSTAGRAGLKVFDVFVAMDGETIADVISLRKHLYNEKNIGDKMEVKFYREGKLEEATLTLSDETF